HGPFSHCTAARHPVTVSCGPDPSVRPSFPTRRSSDLDDVEVDAVGEELPAAQDQHGGVLRRRGAQRRDEPVALGGGHRAVVEVEDRKSTRLNSSHVKISYAVFCLKKKKTTPRGRSIVA